MAAPTLFTVVAPITEVTALNPVVPPTAPTTSTVVVAPTVSVDASQALPVVVPSP